MKTNVFILMIALMLGFTATAQEVKTSKRKGNITTEKQLPKIDANSVSAIQTKKLNKFLKLSDSQTALVNGLIEKHLQSGKYTDLLAKFSGNNLSKSAQKEEGFDPLSAELFNDKNFTKDINTVLDDKQKEDYKELVNKFLSPK